MACWQQAYQSEMLRTHLAILLHPRLRLHSVKLSAVRPADFVTRLNSLIAGLFKNEIFHYIGHLKTAKFIMKADTGLPFLQKWPDFDLETPAPVILSRQFIRGMGDSIW